MGIGTIPLFPSRGGSLLYPMPKRGEIVLQEGSVSTLESFITAVPKETAEIAERKKNENMRTWARMVADL